MLTREAYNKIKTNIIGKTFNITNSKNKGIVGLIAEELINCPHSSKQCDFDDGELKTFPLNYSKKGKYTAKETIAVTMLDYNENFNLSRFFNKLSQVIFVGYIKDKDNNTVKFIGCYLWSISFLEDIIKKQYHECLNEHNIVKGTIVNDKLKKGCVSRDLIEIRTKGNKSSNTFAWYLKRKFINTYIIDGILKELN